MNVNFMLANMLDKKKTKKNQKQIVRNFSHEIHKKRKKNQK